MTVTYVLEGAGITDLDRFWQVVGEAVNGPGGYFGRGLDSFADCLGGGMGTPPDGDFTIEWRDHGRSVRALGHAETARYLRRLLEGAHPTNRTALQGELLDALAGRGPTLFDRLVEIVRTRTAPGTLRLN
ncbi:barstar family protein [Streptomyces sp. DT24]|uniref:barstar family protein n=1 Tax=unclassified Streptomyces TaxID=2593676 RepID=UPI0023B8AD5C|nr:barstar family protein [Streptomyces sp. AM 4-1-1]WEH36545.1 barstar family protein [Streptomyces sp. AM 4-1-1]